jgi:LysM repeat protein
MLIKRLIPCLLAAFLMLPVYVFSQTEEIKEYKVKKGDTLWDISNKELQDPFLWPKIWKENPEISNPDLIYPGQSIKIPLYLLHKETKEEPIQEPVSEKVQEPEKEVAQEEPAPVAPLVDKKLYISSGYIGDYIVGLGKITGSPQERNLFGVNDSVYIKTDSNVDIGNKFYIIRVGKEVRHPATKQKMGYVIEILGIAEVSKFEYGETIAKITESYKDIITGDILDTFYEMEPPVVPKPFRKPVIEGYVLATNSQHIMNINQDIVYIDKGQADGFQPGDILKTLAVGAHKVPNGTIQIISLKDNTATAIVVSSTDAVMAGNQINQAE